MAFESFQLKKIQKPKKIGSISATIKYDGYLEDFLAAPKGQTTSSAPTINYCYGLKEELETLTFSAPTNNYCRNLRERLKTLISFALTNNYCCSLKKRLETQTSSTLTNNHCCSLKKWLEIQLVSLTSTLFFDSFNIPKDILSSIGSIEMGYILQHKYCWHTEIKNLTPTTCSIYKYT